MSRRAPRAQSPDLLAAEAEARRRIERRDARAELERQLAAADALRADVDRLIKANLPIAGDALRAEARRLEDEHVRLRIALNSTTSGSWGQPDAETHAREGEGLAETTWRVLLDRGATGYRIAELAGATLDSALRKRMDRWRSKLRIELESWRDELVATAHPWERTRALLAQVDAALARLG